MKRKITFIELIIVICVVFIIVKLWSYNIRSSTPEAPYIFVKKWGSSGSKEGQFSIPYAIAVDSDDNIYVADPRNHCVQKFDSEGNFLLKWGTLFEITYEVMEKLKNKIPDSKLEKLKTRMNKKLTLKVLDYLLERTFTKEERDLIVKYSRCESENKDAPDICLHSPEDIYIDTDGNIYIADYGNDCIQKIDSEGNLLLTWGREGSHDGEFSGPSSIAVNRHECIYVSDDYDFHKFDFKGNFITKWEELSDRVHPHPSVSNIIIDSKNYVYVIYHSYIQKFDSSGKLLDKWGSYGNKDESFSGAYGMTIDSNDRIFITESGKKRIQVFDTSGNFLMEWNYSGFWSRYFREPGDVAVDSKGNVYVTDHSQRDILKFKPNPDYRKTINEKEEK